MSDSGPRDSGADRTAVAGMSDRTWTTHEGLRGALSGQQGASESRASGVTTGAAPNRPVATHRVTWDGDQPTFHCDGRDDADCHWWPDCECEYWGNEHNSQPGHQPVPQRECWVLTWLENVDLEFTYGDDEHPASEIPHRDASIEWEWDGDGVRWAYADGGPAFLGLEDAR